MTIKNQFVAPSVGDSVTFRKTMTVAEQAMFTGISGNLGGLYVDRGKAKAAGLADISVFELAAASLLTTCLSRLAGSGHRIASYGLDFEKAITVGTTVEAVATLVSNEGGSFAFKLALNADGAALASGEARLVPAGES
ncbi:MaoC/PaaZ C-terminal domain-containing protein [Aquamicrobium sp. LC103]|uniref:MaoC/PaaZ C-terminal domain-containing protein n=1 Tax=Aquamicrobium sp. LC103 TaxID=1120658 RepID=UPI00063EC268|nr:MaoC/PaaZ C-terminal domain-containing protein [Aquamicrobium sp. LC103]TKT74406.1 acyl dehydratase [Aquamicrobium sp. LC103]